MKVLLHFLLASLAFAQTRQIAITIDDLPRGGDQPGPRSLARDLAFTRKFTAALGATPVTVFINASQSRAYTDAGLQALLALWRSQGAELGNHTFSHPDLNSIPLAEYQADILRGEPAIRLARGGTPSTYFRHPFLRTGATPEIKDSLAKFLTEHHYTPAPVTVDASDWMFARAYTTHRDPSYVLKEYLRHTALCLEYYEQRALAVFGRPIPHVLLIHANQLNADAMPQLLAFFASRGYQIVPLATALADPAYQTPDPYVGKGGYTWLTRWGIGKDLKPAPEPDEPLWLTEHYRLSR